MRTLRAVHTDTASNILPKKPFDIDFKCIDYEIMGISLRFCSTCYIALLLYCTERRNEHTCRER